MAIDTQSIAVLLPPISAGDKWVKSVVCNDFAMVVRQPASGPITEFALSTVATQGVVWDVGSFTVAPTMTLGAGAGTTIVLGSGYDGVLVSYNLGSSWATVALPDGQASALLGHANGMFIRLSTYGLVYSSPTGAVWTAHGVADYGGASVLWDAIIFSGGYYYLAGAVYSGGSFRACVAKSADLTTWTYSVLGGAVTQAGIAAVEGVLVAPILPGNTVKTSADGGTWATVNIVDAVSGLGYNMGGPAAVGGVLAIPLVDQGYVRATEDGGATWELISTPSDTVYGLGAMGDYIVGFTYQSGPGYMLRLQLAGGGGGGGGGGASGWWKNLRNSTQEPIT